VGKVQFDTILPKGKAFYLLAAVWGLEIAV